ncbi:MAG TPA: hypothetical protein VNC60_03380 [Actinomycetota bacterium]|nr:hypothetical protein [Actinomycetota bacterium]
MWSCAPAKQLAPDLVGLDLESLVGEMHGRFDALVAGREQAIPAARKSIRFSANAIRAVHREELDAADSLIAESGRTLGEARQAVAELPDLRAAGYVQDPQKEYAEAHITRALVAGEPLPGPQELGVDDAPT